MKTTATSRPAAVAGSFYPGDAATLLRDVRNFLATAVSPAPTLAKTNASSPKAIIVPHAGYIYSGAVAAAAYAKLAPVKGIIQRVVLLGPCHRVALQGIGIPTVERFVTPLGDIPLDRAALDSLCDLPAIQLSDAAHAQEHSLEVQLPFLQAILGNFSLVPLAVGQTSTAVVAQVIDRLWGGPETMFIISSDLSHFHPYAEAQAIDTSTVHHISHLELLTSFDQACGALPINGMLDVARRRFLDIELLDVRNSGDTAGDKSRVVGYASFALYENPASTPSIDNDELLGTALLSRARNAIAAHFQRPPIAEPAHPALTAPGATFVTLTQSGQLRGCIGSLEAHRPLDADVRANALAAALRDPRFSALNIEELDRTRVEVSLLTAAQGLNFRDEADALAKLRPHIDGVIFVAGKDGGNSRSTFLPQVWEQLPDPRQFMAHLKQKAGLNAAYWSPEVKIYIYQVKKWKEAPNP